MIPDAMDKDILEYVANDEPWHIVCGAFYHQFENPRELIDRIFRLYDVGLLEISKSLYKNVEPTPELFEKEAMENNWFEDKNYTEGLWWDIQATEKGFEYVKDRFRKIK